MKRKPQPLKTAKETAQTYPASTTTPFIVLLMNWLVGRGWVSQDIALWIIAAWPAFVTFLKQKVVPRLFGESDEAADV